MHLCVQGQQQSPSAGSSQRLYASGSQNYSPAAPPEPSGQSQQQPGKESQQKSSQQQQHEQVMRHNQAQSKTQTPTSAQVGFLP